MSVLISIHIRTQKLFVDVQVYKLLWLNHVTFLLTECDKLDLSEACVRVSFLNLVKDQIWLKRALKAWYFWFSLKDFTINRLKSYIYYETVLLIELPENRNEGGGTRCFTAAPLVGFFTSNFAASHGTCIPHVDDWSLGSPALSVLTNQRPAFRSHDPYQPIRSLLVFSILP